MKTRNKIVWFVYSQVLSPLLITVSREELSRPAAEMCKLEGFGYCAVSSGLFIVVIFLTAS